MSVRATMEPPMESLNTPSTIRYLAMGTAAIPLWLGLSPSDQISLCTSPNIRARMITRSECVSVPRSSAVSAVIEIIDTSAHQFVRNHMAQELKELSREEILRMDQLQLVEAHVSIVEDSVDVESVRTSAVALLNTEAGRAYVAFNPIAI